MELKLESERRHNKIYSDDQYTYKIFNEGYEKKDVFQEAFITSKIEKLDINSPIIDSIYQTDNKWTMKLELIKGNSLFNIMKEDSSNVSKCIEKLVLVQTSIHKNFCTAIPRQKAKLTYGINSTDLDNSFKFDLLEMLDSSPKHKKLCHGNLTPHNVIVDGDECYILDWNHACQGNASADVARTYIWFRVNMPEYAELYLNSFCKLSNTSSRYVHQWLPIVAAARLSKDNPDEKDTLLDMIKLIEY